MFSRYVNLNYCVAFFFFLSFVFQTLAALPFGPVGGFGYLFTNSSVGDEETIDLIENPQDKASNKVIENAGREIRFNWLRFVEYSASGSLVLFTIAILLGITDVDLLVCIFILAATCMLLGILAEVFQRSANCLRGISSILLTYNDVKGTSCAAFLLKLVWIFETCFWLAHLLGWLCIVVPWVIIYVRFASW